jgi:hypothetical protein
MRFASIAWPLLVLPLLAGCGPSETERKAAQQALQDEIELSWRTFSRCLVGEPLAKGEVPSMRMRFSELTLMLSGSDQAKSEWPKNCGDLAGECAGKLADEKLDAGKEADTLRSKLVLLRGATPAVYFTGDAKRPFVDEIWAAAKDAGLEPQPKDAEPLPADGPVAPAATAPLARDKLVELGTSGGHMLRYDLVPGKTVLFMVGGDGDKPLFCQIKSQKQALDHAECHALGRDPSIVATPLSRDGDGVPWYSDRDPKRAAWNAAGDTVNLPFDPSAYVFADGTIADINKMRLIRKSARRKERVALRAPPGGTLIGYRAGLILWRAAARGKPNIRPLLVQKVQTGVQPLGTFHLAGNIPREVKHVEACRTDKGIALALVGPDPKKAAGASAERTAAMTFSKGNRWHNAVVGKMAGATKAWSQTTWRAFNCRDEEATLTWLRADERVGQLRCTPKGCESKLSEPISSAGRKGKPRIVDLGGKVLYVSVVAGKAPLAGLTETVVMRFAPVDQLAAAPLQGLVGVEGHAGLPNLRSSVGLMANYGAAIALVQSGDRFFGARIEATGKVSKLTVK